MLSNYNSIDEYLRYGGILSTMDNANKFYIKKETFRFITSHSIGSYVDTAICDNIVHVIKHNDNNDWRNVILKDIQK